jgi:hypothetical protein
MQQHKVVMNSPAGGTTSEKPPFNKATLRFGESQRSASSRESAPIAEQSSFTLRVKPDRRRTHEPVPPERERRRMR